MPKQHRALTVIIPLLALVLATVGVVVGTYTTMPFLDGIQEVYLAATYFALGCLVCIFIYGLMASPFVRMRGKDKKESKQDQAKKEEEVFAAEEAKKWSHELETRVEERSRELEKTSVRLMRTREKLFEAEKLAFLGQLAAGISHQMKNPLGIIKTAAFFVTDATEDDDVSEQSQIIANEADRMVETINGLLRFARQAAASTMTEADCADLIADTLKAVELGGRLQNIVVETDIDDDLDPLQADGSQILQVLLNLITNATQAMGDDGGTLTVSARQDGDLVEIKITDTGEGIPLDRLDHIWEPFVSHRDEGTGIGLAICKGILDRHHAQANVVSEEGMGTTFTLRLKTAN